MALEEPQLEVAEIIDPQIFQDLISEVQIKGFTTPLQLLNFAIPTINLRNIVPVDVAIRTPVYQATQVFDAGTPVAVAANAVLLDTGQLGAGTYDLQLSAGFSGVVGPIVVFFEHRDAANAVNRAVITVVTANGAQLVSPLFSWVLAENERVRMINSGVAQTAGQITGNLMIAIRS